MELVSLHTLARTEEGRPLWLTYKLLCRRGRYGVLCYLEGVDQARHPHASARVEGLCASRPKAEELLHRLARGAVTPQHLQDLIWEM